MSEKSQTTEPCPSCGALPCDQVNDPKTMPFKPEVDMSSGLAQYPLFSCPNCGKFLVLWFERFKGSGKVIAQLTHKENGSSHCDAPAPGVVSP
jgi:hypothetical protein